MNLAHHLHHKLFATLSDIAAKKEVSAFVIGGYVRDIFLNRPSSDVDIVVLGSGIELARAVAEELETSKFAYYKNFGTASLTYDGIKVEFVGARKESYQRHSRHPIVEDGSLADDQDRRDFTINTIAVCLSKSNFGAVIDPHNGVADIKKGSIRTPLEPNKTYADDPLRMMRAIRFAAQLGFTVVDSSLQSISKNADRLRIVSQERITAELQKIVLSPKPSVGFELLFTTGLLQQFFPEMVALQGVETKHGRSHKDNFYHTLKVLDNISVHTDYIWLRWAAILHDIAKPATKRYCEKSGWTFHGHEDRGARMVPSIFKRLKLPMGAPMKYVQKLVRLHLRPIALVDGRVTDAAVRRLLFEAGTDVEDLLTLCNADITTKNDVKLQRYRTNFKKVAKKLKEIEEKDHIRNFQPPISGENIMTTFNLTPCRTVGVLKETIKEAILEGTIKNDYQEAYALLLQKGREMGLTVHTSVSSDETE